MRGTESLCLIEEGKRVEKTGNWRKSSYSGADGGECVEVASTSGTVMVRDTKDRKAPR